MTKYIINHAAVALGRIRSKAKAAASRRNGRLGGRPALLKLAKDGSVALLRCQQNHSGNARFYPLVKGKWCECVGCGNIRSWTDCIAEQQNYKLLLKSKRVAN